MTHDVHAHTLVDAILQLRQSALHAVVTGTEFTSFQRALRIEDGLFLWLHQCIADALRLSDGRPYDLIVLSGNAGDGKSALLAALIHGLAKTEASKLRVIEDATHTDSPTESLSSRLLTFFEPFEDSHIHDARHQPLHLIAMNVGAVRRFFDQLDAPTAAGFQRLKRKLFADLHLPCGEATEPGVERVLVVNLDRRRLLGIPNEETTSFFRAMIERLNPNGEALSPYREACGSCPARTRCFVRQNLTLLQQEFVQNQLERYLWQAHLSGVHLNPRNLWDFLSQVAAGDLEFFRAGKEPGNACDQIRAWAESATFHDWYRRLFFNLLFEHPNPDAAERDRGALFRALAELDPKYAVSRRVHEVAAQAEIDPESEVRQTPEADAAAWILPAPPWQSKETQLVAGGAVRRDLFFPRPVRGEASAEEADLDHFLRLARDYQSFNEQGRSSRDLVSFVSVFASALGIAFGKKKDGLIYFQLENPLSQNRIPVWVEAPRLTRDSIEYERHDPHLQLDKGLQTALQFLPSRIKVRFLDPDTPENLVTLDLDYPLFSLVHRVDRGYLATPSDMVRRFHLRYVIQRWARIRAENGARLLVHSIGKDFNVYSYDEKADDGEFGTEPEWEV